MKFAAIVCARCRRARTVETRHATASCPHCGVPATLAQRTPIWTGDDVAGGQAAILMHAGGTVAVAQAARPTRARDLPHDSPTMAAASKATGIVNRSEKAEAVTRALLEDGTASHIDLVQAMLEAGLDGGRAQSEVVRMLATDFILEPRPGRYRLVG
ncbi:MAG: hypothetical protein V4510_07795 [bacterium]